MNARMVRLLGSVLVLLITIAGVLLSTQRSQSTGSDLSTARAEPSAVAQVTASVATATVTPGRITPTATSTPGGRSAAAPTATIPAGGKPTPTQTPRGQSAATNDGLPLIDFGALPPQARETILLIERGGPFPYDRDGITFGNRERLLPIRTDGYYREYTVITPGSSDRGARRIIAGQGGELYYTDDHYESFKRVKR
ncbi:MAG TPA: ribonuclease domain-containing protein [Thermomicrobiales bacterium]|jgi:ribonuclease T1